MFLAECVSDAGKAQGTLRLILHNSQPNKAFQQASNAAYVTQLTKYHHALLVQGTRSHTIGLVASQIPQVGKRVSNIPLAARLHEHCEALVIERARLLIVALFASYITQLA